MAASTMMDASYDRKRYVKPCVPELPNFVEAELFPAARRARRVPRLAGSPAPPPRRRGAISGSARSPPRFAGKSRNAHEAEFATEKRVGALEEDILHTKANLAVCYSCLGRDEEALALRREIYARSLALGLSDHFSDVLNLAVSLKVTQRYTEARSFMREQLPKARRALGAENDAFLRLRGIYANALRDDHGSSRDDVVEAVTIFEELASTTRRVYGEFHPFAKLIQHELMDAQEKLAAFDASHRV